MIVFQLSTPTAGDGVDLSDLSLIVTYIDKDQVSNIAIASVTRTWLLGTGDVLNSEERVEFQVDLTGLTTRLGASKDFEIQVKPAQGATLIVSKRTPAELTLVTNLN